MKTYEKYLNEGNTYIFKKSDVKKIIGKNYHKEKTVTYNVETDKMKKLVVLTYLNNGEFEVNFEKTPKGTVAVYTKMTDITKKFKEFDKAVDWIEYMMQFKFFK